MTTAETLLLLSLSLVLASCGARSGTSPPSSPKSSAPPASSLSALGGPRGEAVPSLDALATRHGREMPLMRETLRVGEAATSKATDLESKTGDTCFRAALAANVPVRAWFEDAQHSERGEPATLADATKSGLVPPRGPACARKGETLKLMIARATTVPQPTGADSAAPFVARAIVWQSP